MVLLAQAADVVQIAVALMEMVAVEQGTLEGFL
jgi:hypothetical protein